MNRWSKWKHSRGKRQKRNKDEKATKNHQQPTAHHRNEWPVIESAMIQPNPNRADHAAAERRFWGRQLRITLWLNIITAIAAVAGLGGLVVLYGTLQATKDATEEANRSWLVPNAPQFVSVPMLNSPVYVFLGFDDVAGQPAQQVQLGTRFDVIDAPSGQDFLRQEKIPNNLCPYIPQIQQLGTIYKAPPDAQSFEDAIRTDSIGNQVIWTSDLASGSKIIRVRGCLSYVTVRKRHYTSFCYVFGPLAKRGDPGLKIGQGCNGGGYAN